MKHTKQQHHGIDRPRDPGRCWSFVWSLGSIAIVCLLSTGLMSAEPAASEPAASATLELTRLSMGKWIETQQIISKERKDWQQGKEILVGRVDLVKKEIATLEEKIKVAEAAVAEAKKKRDELVAENNEFKANGQQLAEAVTLMEGEIRRLYKALPQPVQEKLGPLYKRIPEDATKTRVSAAERFQNILGILNEVNKTNNEITISYEVHTLADGKPSEVKAIYVGLAQAYYVSSAGEGGISHPTLEGWKWEPSKIVARDVLMALDILQGKHSPAFVPLPVKMQ